MRMAQSIQTMQVMNKEESKKLMAMWPDIVRDIIDAIKSLNIPDMDKWMEKVLQYNVLGGKKIGSLTLIYAYKLFVPSDQLTEDNIRLARILAWCLEIMQASFLVLRDITDRSLFREGKPCWYRNNDMGELATNDGVLLESTIYFIIQKYFNEKEYYIDLLETFQDITLKTVMGQCLELHSTNFGKKPNLDLFTMNRYNSIVEYKTSYYSFILPVTVVMQLAGIKDPEMFKQAISILSEIGRFYQIQDDYISCFGDPEVCDKNDTDIQNGKCTWLIVMALQRATPEQREILDECYGVSDPEKIKRVKQLFVDLNLPDVYSTFEEATYNFINLHLLQMSHEFPDNFFADLLGQFYHRKS